MYCEVFPWWFGLTVGRDDRSGKNHFYFSGPPHLFTLAHTAVGECHMCERGNRGWFCPMMHRPSHFSRCTTKKNCTTDQRQKKPTGWRPNVAFLPLHKHFSSAEGWRTRRRCICFLFLKGKMKTTFEFNLFFRILSWGAIELDRITTDCFQYFPFWVDLTRFQR